MVVNSPHPITKTRVLKKMASAQYEMSSSSEEEMEKDEEEEEELQLRKELSEVPLGELQQLREKVGSKKFDVVLQSKLSEHKDRKKNFKRANKNRPREMSSKKRVSRFRQVVHMKKKETGRDPRFDDKCGKLNQDLFEKSYSFLEEIKEQDKILLEKEAKKSKSNSKKQKITSLLQKMESRDATRKKIKDETSLEREHMKMERELIKEGKKPFFITQSLKKKVLLAKKYKTLKESGQLKSFLMKKRKRNAARDRKQLPLTS